jgi:hypothetical protein
MIEIHKTKEDSIDVYCFKVHGVRFGLIDRNIKTKNIRLFKLTK